jgi:hypothetical protein
MLLASKFWLRAKKFCEINRSLCNYVNVKDSFTLCTKIHWMDLIVVVMDRWLLFLGVAIEMSRGTFLAVPDVIFGVA